MNEGVLICGLGVRPEEDTSVETLEALETCRVVYSDLADDDHFDWLRRHFPTLRRTENASKIVDAARVRPNVGLAVWGHPRYTSRLARRVETHCRRYKVALSFMPASSPITSALARSKAFLGGDEGYGGIQAYDLDALIARPAMLLARLPIVIYAERGPRKRWALLAELLLKRYPADHPVHLQPTKASESLSTLQALAAMELAGAVLVPPLRRPRNHKRRAR